MLNNNIIHNIYCCGQEPQNNYYYYENFMSSFGKLHKKFTQKSIINAHAAWQFFFLQPIMSLICGTACHSQAFCHSVRDEYYYS